MKNRIEIYKGLHPGQILERELKKRGIAQGKFALSIQEYPQTINGIIKKRVSVNPRLSIKMSEYFGFESSFFAQIQSIYDVEQEKKNLVTNVPQAPVNLRKATFWDTDLDDIDWDKHKRFVIERVLQYGNQEEKSEIERYYGKEEVRQYGKPVNSFRIHSLEGKPHA